MEKMGRAGLREEATQRGRPLRQCHVRQGVPGKKLRSWDVLHVRPPCVGGAGEEAPRRVGGHRGTNAAQYEGVWLGIGDEEEQI